MPLYNTELNLTFLSHFIAANHRRESRGSFGTNEKQKGSWIDRSNEKYSHAEDNSSHKTITFNPQNDSLETKIRLLLQN